MDDAFIPIAPMKKFTLAAVLTVLVACSSSSKRINGPDGSPNWFAVTCHHSHVNCLEEAGKVCPNGYKSVVTVNQDGTLVYGNPTADAVGVRRNEMLIKCDGPVSAE